MLTRRNIILVIIVLIVWGVIASMVYDNIADAETWTYDFYPHYVGGRTVWSQSTPYTDEVMQEIQMGMFGYLLPDDVDQQRFSYPAYSSVIIAPFLTLTPSQSMAAWTSLQLVSILVAILLMFPLLQWRPLPMMLFFVAFGFGFLFRHPINTFVLGQFTGIMLLLVVGGMFCLLYEKDIWAGILLALSVNPPTITGPLAIGILGVYLLLGRWRGLTAFLATLFTLAIISIVLIGWWIPDFVDNLSAYSQYAESVWIPDALPILLAIPYVIGLALLVGWFVLQLKSEFSTVNQIDLFMVSTIAALLVLPQTGAYYFVLLIPPMMVTLYRAERLPSRVRWAFRGGITVITISVWGYWRIWGEHTMPEALGLPMSVLIIYLVARNFAVRKQQYH